MRPIGVLLKAPWLRGFRCSGAVVGRLVGQFPLKPPRLRPITRRLCGPHGGQSTAPLAPFLTPLSIMRDGDVNAER